MDRIIPPNSQRNEQSEATNEINPLFAKLFSAICKPAYAKRLTEIISEKQATVFSAGFCPYCNKAKKLLEKNQVEYKEVMLDEISGVDQMEVANCIYGMDERRFVPFVYLNQERLGSYSELHQMDHVGTLKPTAAALEQKL